MNMEASFMAEAFFLDQRQIVGVEPVQGLHYWEGAKGPEPSEVLSALLGLSPLLCLEPLGGGGRVILTQPT